MPPTDIEQAIRPPAERRPPAPGERDIALAQEPAALVQEPAALVQLSGVTRRYGRLIALREVDLTIIPGEFVFLIGPSEAGKTTLLKLVHGDLRPNRGAVCVDGQRLHRRWRRSLPLLRRRVAAVFQDHRLLPDMTARGNVSFALQVADLGMPRAEVRSRAQVRLEEVGLGGRAGAYPHQLSGGQQRRLAIARALGHDPVLLLADEPTANLDRRNAERVLDLLERRCRAGTAVLVATHDVDLALARRHRVVELREGRIVADRPAQAPPPGAAAARRAGTQARRRRPAFRARLGRVAQLLLGYTPPPPPSAKEPRPRLGFRARAGRVAQVLLGYEPPPAAATPNGAWRPPAEVAARLANGHGSRGGNGIVAPVPMVPAAELGRDDGGAWRPPASMAEAAPIGGVGSSVNGGSNGHVDGNGQKPHPRRLGRVAQVVLGFAPPPPPAVPRPRRRLRAGIGRAAQFVLGYTPPPAPPRRASRTKAAPRRWPWTPVANLGRLAVGGAMASWGRNFGTAAPALGSITLLLLLGGILSVAGFAVNSVLSYQESEASVLHVYLGDDATRDQIDMARQGLAVLPHVRSVTYVDKSQALAQARQRPGLSELASLSDTNPFPASLEVHVDQPGDVASVARIAAAEPGVDAQRPTSYDKGTYQRLRQFTAIAIAAAGAFGLLLLLITYAISSNSIRAAVLARRDELVTMQLVGASRWLIRVRLGVEGALTGGLAGLIAAGLVVGVCVAAFYGARHLYVQVLPGVTAVMAGEVVAGIGAVGLCLGTVSALFAFRRVRT